MKLDKVLSFLNEYSVLNYADFSPEEFDVSGLAYDSRKVQAGYMYFCIPGFKTDGHKFAGDAVKKGAKILIVENKINGIDVVQIKVNNSREALALISAGFYDFPAKKMRLIGVTGTNGKTTTTFLIKALLEDKFKVGLIGTINNMIGEEIILSERTTPESLDLQKLFYEMRSKGVDIVVMEVSSHALELNRVDGVSFDAGVYTNLTQDHLDFHADLDAYKLAKSKLFKKIGSEIKPDTQYAVLNKDDEYYDFFYKACKVPIYSYGIQAHSDFSAEDVVVTGEGASFKLSYPGGFLNLNLKITGFFNIYNTLAAFVTAYTEGIMPQKMKNILEHFSGVPGRFEKVDLGQEFVVIVDYAHTPDSLKNVLLAARSFIDGRIITVFGCGGDRDKTKRPLMGEIASKHSDYNVITSDNPRSEIPKMIINDIIPGIEKENTPYQIIVDRKAAIEYALKMAEKGDLVLIAGKGHETYQEVNGKVYSFDDKLEAKKILNKLVSH